MTYTSIVNAVPKGKSEALSRVYVDWSLSKVVGLEVVSCLLSKSLAVTPFAPVHVEYSLPSGVNWLVAVMLPVRKSYSTRDCALGD